MSAESVVEEFDTLTLAQVYGALAHYLENQEAVDAYRVRQRRRFAIARNEAPPIPDDLRQRLNEARAQLAPAKRIE